MQTRQLPPVPVAQRMFGDIVYWITIVAAIICIVGPLVTFSDMEANVLNPFYLMDNVLDGMKPSFEEQELQADVMAGATTIRVEDGEQFDDPEKVDRDVLIRIMDEDGNGEIATVVARNKSEGILTLERGLLNSYQVGHTEVAEVTVWDSKGFRRLAEHTVVGQDTLHLVTTERIDAPSADHSKIVIIVEDANNREAAVIKSIDRDTNTITLEARLQNAYKPADNATITQVTVVDDTEGGHFWLDEFTAGDGLTQFGLVLGCAVGLPAMIGAAILFFWKDKSKSWALTALWIALMIGTSAIGIINLH